MKKLKIDKRKILIIIPILIMYIFMYKICKVLLSDDDEVYRDAFNNLPTFISWIKEVLALWSGRIPILALTNFFMHLPLRIFRICNAFIFTSIIISINIISNIILDDLKTENRRKLLYVTFALIFFVDIVVLSGGAFWLCGSLNYLWPFAFMLISIIPFIALLKNKKLKSKYYIVFMLSNLICCFSEQSGAVLVAFGLLTIIYCIYNKIKPDKLLIVHYIMIAIITILSLKAPGNSVRFFAEQTRWYPEFAMLSMGDKLLQGYINLANHIVNYATLLLFILSISIAYLITRNSEIKKHNKFISLIPVIYFGLRLIPFNQHTQKINESLFVFNRFGLNNLYNYAENTKIFLSFIILAILAIELIYVWKNKKNGIITSILYCAGMCSAMAMSISPTIFASGNRTFFATDFIIILINTILIGEIFKKVENKESKISIIIILLVFASVFYINICSNWLEAVIW